MNAHPKSWSYSKMIKIFYKRCIYTRIPAKRKTIHTFYNSACFAISFYDFCFTPQHALCRTTRPTWFWLSHSSSSKFPFGPKTQLEWCSLSLLSSQRCSRKDFLATFVSRTISNHPSPPIFSGIPRVRFSSKLQKAQNISSTLLFPGT